MTAADELRRALERAAAELTPEEARAFLGPLLAAVLERAVQPPQPSPIAAPDPVEQEGERIPLDRGILTVAETARVFGRSKWWVYANRHKPPLRAAFKPLPGGGFGFRKKSIDRWIQKEGS